ncbi:MULTISPECIES: hypothetical protein [unclassified Psychrobacter]|uniref:hypothetical protein n=1 Tax=unclassified Psychrobacter TaxID=196806 RepID=UPI0018F6E51D|nr:MULTISPECIES: hypothetical protein [unclassified Psychrobacter]
MSNKSEIADSFFEEMVRCEKMIPLYMSVCDRPSQDLIDAISENAQVCKLLEIPEDTERADDIVERLYRKHGFLAQFATPNPFSFSTDGSMYTSGWGFYATKWFYADNIEKLESEAIKWARENFEERKKTDLMKANEREGEYHG